MVFDPAADLRQGRVGGVAVLTENHEVVGVSHHPIAQGRHPCVQRMQIDVGQQRADHRPLGRSRRRRPSVRSPHDIGRQPAAQQIEDPAIADPFLHPPHQPLVRNAVEVGLEVGVHHEGVAVLDQSIHFAQRVMATPSRSEAVAPLQELHLEDRFDHELHRPLHDPVLDRRDAQRPRSTIALGDVHPSDRLRPVGSRSQRLRQLGQINLRPGLEPLEAHAIHARRPAIGPDLRPGRRQGGRRIHLVDQAEPFAAFDAVDQRRDHAVGPYRGFRPGQVRDVCALLSPRGH